MKIGNINYFNYGLSPKQIKNSFEFGPPSYPAVPPNENENKPAYLSAFNKIDMYNY